MTGGVGKLPEWHGSAMHRFLLSFDYCSCDLPIFVGIYAARNTSLTKSTSDF